MLTGDRADVAAAVAKELGIDEFRAQLLPQDKVAEVEKLLEETHERGSGKGKLAFVGDGINDAPVLTRADIGIAMGAMGSDAAIEAADVVLMDDKPSNIARAIGIARKTMGIAEHRVRPRHQVPRAGSGGRGHRQHVAGSVRRRRRCRDRHPERHEGDEREEVSRLRHPSESPAPPRERRRGALRKGRSVASSPEKHARRPFCVFFGR